MYRSLKMNRLRPKPTGPLNRTKPARAAVLGVILALAVLSGNFSRQAVQVLPGTVVEDPSCSEPYFTRRRLKEWENRFAPLPHSAIEHSITKETYVIFKIEDRHVFGAKHSLVNATWACNGKKAHFLAPDPFAMTACQMVTIVCPPLKGPLKKINLKLSSGKRFRYRNLAKWWNCQVNHHPVTKRLTSLHIPTARGTDATKNSGGILSHIVVSTMIHGAGSQAYLPQWIEYHRLVFGIGHFFIYVDDAWEVFSRRGSYQEWDYVTYVPLAQFADPTEISKPDKEEFPYLFFQVVQQNDMLLRLKAFELKGANTPLSKSLWKDTSNSITTQSEVIQQQSFGSQVQWIGMFDIDEYLYVSPAAEVPSHGMQGDLTYRYAQYLDALLAPYGPDSSQDWAGVDFENVFYDDVDGRVPLRDRVRGDEKAEAMLLCDFWYRSISSGLPDLTDDTDFGEVNIWYRQKFFARPDVAIFANIHVLLVPKTNPDDSNYVVTIERTKHLNPETELRQNHFKLGFGEEFRVNITDTSMKDEFCEWFRTRMDSSQ